MRVGSSSIEGKEGCSLVGSGRGVTGEGRGGTGEDGGTGGGTDTGGENGGVIGAFPDPVPGARRRAARTFGTVEAGVREKSKATLMA